MDTILRAAGLVFFEPILSEGSTAGPFLSYKHTS